MPRISSVRLPPLTRPCGYRIVRGARRGERLPANECAFVTYVIKSEGAVLGVVATPAGVYWGPGDTIQAELPSGNPMSRYVFVGGVVFKNC